jgi:YggT family protein
LLRPLEARLLRSGHDPQDASLWLVGAAVVAGLGVLTLLRWSVSLIYSLGQLGQATPLVAIRLGLGWALGLVMTALLIRVIAGWLGISPYSGVLRLVAKITDWIVVPVRRYLPHTGPLDLSPAIAYLILLLLRALLAT